MNKNEKGFSLVEGLLVVLIVTVIGFAGWYVLNANKNVSTVKSDKQDTATTSEDKDTNTTSQSKFFEIKELGVKFEQGDDLEGLYYHLGNDGKTAYFSLEELKSTDCAADKTAQVALNRYTEQDFEQDGPTAALKQNAKKIGDYYYFSMGGQAACSEDEAIQAKGSKLRADITQLLPGALVQMQ
jgi:hypothetical protein